MTMLIDQMVFFTAGEVSWRKRNHLRIGPALMAQSYGPDMVQLMPHSIDIANVQYFYTYH
jgi:hypothetical protein